MSIFMDLLPWKMCSRKRPSTKAWHVAWQQESLVKQSAKAPTCFRIHPKLKGKFPQTMWIGWVESNFTNPTVKVWADLDNPFKRSDYAKLRMLPSLDGTLPEYVISQEDNSPLNLCIDFHNFLFFLDINSPFDQVHSWMHAHSFQPKHT